ncbi:MAG TPA: trypsin-like peptidase domain-containing protein [Gaiellaceae bacterium]|nr:trypsin-like peptidase domain-containing protein [Gaiellaceae bacterium]
MRTFTNQRAKAAAAVSAAALLGAGGGAAVLAALDSSDPAPRQVTVAATAQPAASTDSKTVGEIYSQSAKAIVEITVTSAGEATQFGGGGGTAQSQGSGFVYDAEGHVITNQHVVDGAKSVTVKFSDGSTYEAEVVGSDPSTDVAVIKVDAPPAVLDALALGDSDAVAVGDGVVAIGSPFGLEQTVTTGIVSALHRQITSPNNFAIDDAIQTDAAINHGNSGGPLLDLQGRVIGVNSQIESESGGNDGVGFAVPSNTVEKIADALIDDGSVEHAYLGVSTQDVGDANGAVISEVRAGTPAAAAGLKSGDVVTKIDGDEVASSDVLRRVIDSHAPGDTVELTLVRDGATKTLKAELGSRPFS